MPPALSSTANAPQRLLGIDPGLRITGFGVIDRCGSKLAYVASGCIRTDEKLPLPERLGIIGRGIAEIVATYAPQQAAIEEVFLNKNPWSTLLLGQRLQGDGLRALFLGFRLSLLRQQLLRFGTAALFGFRRQRLLGLRGAEIRAFTLFLRQMLLEDGLLAALERIDRQSAHDGQNDCCHTSGAQHTAPIGGTLAAEFAIRHIRFGPAPVKDLLVDAIAHLQTILFDAHDASKAQHVD